MNNMADYTDFEAESPFDFTKRSTVGCGGKSKIAFYPKTRAEMVALLRRLETEGKRYFVAGNLSNVLPADGETETVIVCTKKMTEMAFEREIYADAGVTSGEFLRFCGTHGYTGGEFLFGVPCTLGGALFMNAGADGRYIAEIVEKVWVYAQGKVQALRKEECGYSYKNSIFMHDGGVILGASFSLLKGTAEEIELRRAYYAARRVHLPTGRSMGCVFKNPDGRSAGALIEGAGLKGLRLGGAKISEKHANFIVNDGGATAADVKTLIELIKNAVFAQYGIRLQEEIRYLT